MPRCPGQDMRYWTAKDIFDVGCPYCGNSIEFWKDEPFRLCRVCRKEVRNPRIDLGCAKWCKFGSQCSGHSVDEQLAAAIVCSIRSGKLPQTREEEVVSDALILAGGPENRSDAGRLVTEGAKMIYALRLRKKEIQ